MNKKNLKKAMTDIFDSLMESSAKEAQADPLFEYLNSKKEWFGDPDEMDLMITHPFKNILEEVIKKSLNTENSLVVDIYLDFSFYENIITKLCELLYGFGCSADRGRFIVESAINWKLTGVLPVFDPKPENYHHPKNGTPEGWMDLVESIQFLRCGRVDKFILSYRSMLPANPKPN